MRSNVRRMRFVCMTSAVLVFIFAFPVLAQELHQDVRATYHARVLEALSEEARLVPGTNVTTTVQELRVEILDGDLKGQVVEFSNDFFEFKPGETLFIDSLRTIEGVEFYSVREPDRRAPLFLFAALFAAVTIVFGGFQGARSLIALAGSLIIILFFLLPTLLSGAPPVATSILFAVAILAFVMGVTHGINRASITAFLGTVAAVALTGILARIAIDMTKLTGFISDEAVYLNLNTGGTLDVSGLLLGAVIIGVLGLLDDITITQTSVVEEIRAAGKTLSHRAIYRRALRVGKEHVGALVNTLALAYAGASLPLLLLFSLSDASALTIINREVFASEIIRTLVGSIGLVLAVPLSTALAVWLPYRGLLAKRGGGHHHHH